MRTFEDVFGRAPAVQAFAPGRVNLLGEHTDYNDGYVLPTAIAQRTIVALGESPLDRFRVYSGELAKLCEFELTAPPAEHFATYVYGCLREWTAAAGPVPPLNIHIRSTVPIGAGLSSSAALEVATLRAVRDLAGGQADDVELALMAQRAEVNYAGVNCGILDQMACSLAAEGSMLFLDTHTLERRILPLPDACELLVLHSGVERSLAASGYNTRRDECREAARLLGLGSLREATLAAAEKLPPPYQRRARHVVTENARVLRTLDGLAAPELGELMSASHASLRDDFEVSTPEVDSLVVLLQAQPGVLGAKMTGGGFGGAVVALCSTNAARRTAAGVLSEYAKKQPHARVLVPALAQ